MKFKAIRLYQEDGRRISRMVEQTLADLDPGDVVIRSEYAAVNYKDARAVTGVGNVISRFPCVPGVEVSGTVVESKHSAFRPGDRVTVQGGRDFGMRRDGAYSEYVRVPGAWIGRVPEGSDAFDMVGMGLAAYTSAVAVDELMRHGVTPDKGKVVVTGGTGGSSSFAIDMLAGLGYHVVASTGKVSEHEYLKKLGAAEIIGRDGLTTGDKPLEEQLWAGAIDVVGGAPLDKLLRSMQKRGVVCAFGNAAGETFTTSIYPFILRSVSLVGVNANHPVPERGEVWQRMMPGGDLHPRHIRDICYTIPFLQLQAHCDKLIAGGVRGRAVVTFGG
ncbi:acrylyl-CoA reductase family protein [Ramlibacter alkalitolerans]|uniref:Acryloyl-CoA reductase n=1 Tax=Ramlibacter alkalitolerans TaxID=2039631 RepID=A0ABS1JQD0_9BURK|nr:acryloyl-CoA reductase [Ramlibacter alkalitolerans]MBL0426469.1 acryloyl-CoA reductase [Ramlibacter alkalitolerans]